MQAEDRKPHYFVVLHWTVKGNSSEYSAQCYDADNKCYSRGSVAGPVQVTPAI